jgi:uncharacterized protein DUF4157
MGVIVNPSGGRWPLPIPGGDAGPKEAGLHAFLRSRGGVPLDDRTRAFMEARLGQDLRDVRVHTDAWAACATQALHARAFTLGSHMVFGAGEYVPETPGGMHLLAHELTHVLQQRHGPPAPRPRLVVGPAEDPLEREADQVATQVMRGGPLPPITADMTGTVRRAVRIVPGSAHITISQPPKVSPPEIPDPGTLGHARDPTLAAFQCSDINAFGSVSLTGDSADVDGCTVGFINVQWIETNWVYYRGRTNSDGSLLLQRGRPPARRQQACRDTASRTPSAGQVWFRSEDSQSPPPGAPLPVKVQADFNDRPRDAARLLQTNSRTGKTNFLREAQIELHFCTILAVQEGSGQFHQVASFYWNAHWQARFQPTDFADPFGAPWTVLVVRGGQGAHVSGIIQGPPTDKRFKDLITAPGAANCLALRQLADDAVEATRPDGTTPNPGFNRGARRESPVWSTFDVRR